MKLAARAAIVAVFAVLAGCGGSAGPGDRSSVDRAEVAEGMDLYRQFRRLEAMAHRGDIRTGLALEHGTPTEVESSEEATAEIREEAEKVFSELNAKGHAVQRAVLAKIRAER